MVGCESKEEVFMEKLYQNLQSGTEKYLTWRKRRKLKKKWKQDRKHPVIDWIEAFLWAAAVVLLINQYLFQAYEIPSSSMEKTLLVRDRIFVNKMIFGPEILPGVGKINGFRTPDQSEVIIFENPDYISRGPVFDIIQRVLYMLTLSFVDLDKDEHGNPRAHFLIKRAIGSGGERIRFLYGDLEIRPEGFDRWLTEAEFKALKGYNYPAQRYLDKEDYPGLKARIAVSAYSLAKITPDPEDLKLSQNVLSPNADGYASTKEHVRTLYEIRPFEERYGSDWRKRDLGWYIPPGWILPLGDNRDNSRDGRYFGPVEISKILGKAMFKYWPVRRVGAIQ